jgi:hypothetical protein
MTQEEISESASALVDYLYKNTQNREDTTILDLLAIVSQVKCAILMFAKCGGAGGFLSELAEKESNQYKTFIEFKCACATLEITEDK